MKPKGGFRRGHFMTRIIGSDGVDYTFTTSTTGEAWRHEPPERFQVPKPWVRQVYEFEGLTGPGILIHEAYHV